MTVPIYILDSFITKNNDNDVTFYGNPAGVCLLKNDDDINDETKQRIATELNQSVTAFVSMKWNKLEEDDDESDTKEKRTIRWFTPIKEIFSCGHATLASLKVLKILNEGAAEKQKIETVKLLTKEIGTIEAFFDQDSEVSFLFPLNLPKPITRNECQRLYHLVGEVLGPSLQTADTMYSPSLKTLMIRLDDRLKETGLRQVTPNFEAILEIDTDNKVDGVLVTVLGNKDKDTPHFYSRYFSPWKGINEDQATGSSHTILAPYWSSKLKAPKILKGHQCSARGGEILASIKADKVLLSGQVKLVIKGKLHI